MKAILTSADVGLVLMFSFAIAAPCSAAEVKFDITIKDLPAVFSATQKELIKTHIRTASKMWTDVIECKSCTIEIVFSIREAVDGDPKKLGYGKSTVSASLANVRKNDKILAEQGWASVLRTGKRPINSKHDIEIELQTAYVLRELWWDPAPGARKAAVPPGKLDALSVILHELGHALAFNGWINPKTGQLDGTHISTYDQWVKWDGRDFYFHGPAAMKVYGRPILLGQTATNYHHVGDERRGIGVDPLLRGDLMTGYRFQWGTRYFVTPLDIAILKDCGITNKQEIKGGAKKKNEKTKSFLTVSE